jgi:hypothetical protein
MSEGKGTISNNDLMMKLVQAKKVMNKVETGNYEKGQINEDLIKLPDENGEQPTQKVVNRPLRTPSPPSAEKIRQSRLPEAIKKAMIENPIPQITLNDGIDMDLVQGAKKLMEREGMISKKTSNNTAQLNLNTTDLIQAIGPIIENVVRKVMDEKLNQILTAHQTQSMNESLVLKVGDSIFKGKITGVNKSK